MSARKVTRLWSLIITAGLLGAFLLAPAVTPQAAAGATDPHNRFSVSGKTRVNGGWSSYVVGHPGDMTGNRTDDIVAVDGSGRLWLYPTANPGAFGSRVRLASGWGDVVKIDGADINGDGYADLFVERRDGSLWVYLAAGRAKLRSTGVRLYSTWGKQKHDWTVIDEGIKGKPALLAATNAGALDIYRIHSNGKLSGRSTISKSGWASMRELADGGDVYGNDRSTLLARDGGGRVRLYSFNAKFTVASGGVIGNGFGSYRNIAVLMQKGTPHFYAQASDGTLYRWGIKSKTSTAPKTPKPPESNAVFVYGTLMTGQPNNSRLSGDYSSKQRTSMSGLALYRMSGYSWPWAVVRSGYTTHGEVYWLKPSRAQAAIADLDRLEGYDPSKPTTNQSYIRVKRTMANGFTAWVYVAGPRTATWLQNSGSVIPSGDWLRR